MSEGTKYFSLEPVDIGGGDDFISSAALIQCSLCETIISESGGPGEDAPVCISCADLLRNGLLRGVVAPNNSVDMGVVLPKDVPILLRMLHKSSVGHPIGDCDALNQAVAEGLVEGSDDGFRLTTKGIGEAKKMFSYVNLADVPVNGVFFYRDQMDDGEIRETLVRRLSGPARYDGNVRIIRIGVFQGVPGKTIRYERQSTTYLVTSEMPGSFPVLSADQSALGLRM